MANLDFLTRQEVELLISSIEANKGKNTEEIWSLEVLSNIKKKIKDHLLAIKDNNCCYCCQNLHGNHRITIDIEHILPKSKYKEYMFSPFNLSVACKRCNMKIKGDKTDFLIYHKLKKKDTKKSESYLLIHPNFDEYFEHLSYKVIIVNNKKIIKYYILNNSPKGSYTYEYFKLMELEIDTVNEAQGITDTVVSYSDLLSEKRRKEIEQLLG